MGLIEGSVVLTAIFGVGFLSGYAARAWLSRRRRERAREQFLYPA